MRITAATGRPPSAAISISCSGCSRDYASVASKTRRRSPAVSSRCARSRAVWVEDRNIADHPTLAVIADENGMDGKALLAATEEEAVKAEYQANTDEAIAIGVFGAPTYVFEGELFWGQDRLQMLEWRLTQKLGPPKAVAPNDDNRSAPGWRRSS